MDIRKFFAATFLVAVLSVPMITNAALISRLGGLAYYDDVANLTWLADANYANTSGYATENNARMRWVFANTWATGLNVGGVTGWRLPDTLQPDASCDGSSSGYNCTGSELGNMFYNVLGGREAGEIAQYHNDNYDLFSNIQTGTYWSGTEVDGTSNSKWHFSFNGGQQRSSDGAFSNYAWAVHDGDVSAVPLPSAFYLFCSGLIGLIGIAKRKKA